MHLTKYIRFLFASLCAVTAAQASVATFNLNYVFSGAVPPAGPNPWLTLKLEDGLALNTVRLTFDATNLSGTEFVSTWWVNLNPAFDPTQLSFAIVPPNPTQLAVGDIQKGINQFKANGDGHYDLLFDFPPPPGSFGAKFTKDEKVVVDVTRAAGISISDFFYESVNSSGSGVYYTAAHIQGIGGASVSAYVGATAIPEPATYAGLLGVAALLGAAIQRRRINRRA